MAGLELSTSTITTADRPTTEIFFVQCFCRTLTKQQQSEHQAQNILSNNFRELLRFKPGMDGLKAAMLPLCHSVPQSWKDNSERNVEDYFFAEDDVSNLVSFRFHFFLIVLNFLSHVHKPRTGHLRCETDLRIPPPTIFPTPSFAHQQRA